MYTQTKLNITVKKVEHFKLLCSLCSFVDLLFFKCLLKQRNKMFTVFFYFSHSLDVVKFGVVQKLLVVS